MVIWDILRPFDVFYWHYWYLVYFVAISYIFPVLVHCIKNNLATLSEGGMAYVCTIERCLLLTIFHTTFDGKAGISQLLN
jgi:hypothetical protein